MIDTYHPGLPQARRIDLNSREEKLEHRDPYTFLLIMTADESHILT